ncbi:hypothetical protein FOJ82_07285 [Tessaracoccus rhinocerotis]|uniref:Peptidase C39-like domain-containing protein n=1 Tax=Tessaracoccus rhinocerotis TaxID=1689449 RepID=A0A553K2G8_9ACTN|nr:C39 family peptidase [Tessaracoccus rhinocerotis]TRY18902.1 hypothetical protein FOJ82_07285 [Tessaracoccus rhinocerotis]
MAALDPKTARMVAGVELNALALTGVFPKEQLAGAEVVEEATAIHDIDGEVLFHRFAVVRGREDVGAVDVAADEVLGDLLLAYGDGQTWNPKALLGEARQRGIEGGMGCDDFDELRFVAYSYPKLAVQFLRTGEEVAMLELFTWVPVPPAGESEHEPLRPGAFERWSLRRELGDEDRKLRSERFNERLGAIRDLREHMHEFGLIPWRIEPERWWEVIVIRLVETREIRYSLRSSHHTSCYELRGQETNVWCVAASTQMLLDFYRYEYTQTRLAEELGLGTHANPNGLPYSRVGDVVTAIEALTSDALDATMVTNPTFATFRNEIRANRPLVSFVPGHSRTVAGYTQNLIPVLSRNNFQGLLVYDPWPPNAGVITRWENFATQVYQYAYTARVGKV